MKLLLGHIPLLSNRLDARGRDTGSAAASLYSLYSAKLLLYSAVSVIHVQHKGMWAKSYIRDTLALGDAFHGRTPRPQHFNEMLWRHVALTPTGPQMGHPGLL
jgi:hypothetical protein